MLLAALLLLAQDAGDHGKCEVKADATPWINRDKDYPADARAAGVEGRVDFEVMVDAEGCVTGCSVIRSSGSRSLDDTTCGMATRNAHPVPARNAEGVRIAASYRYSFLWFLPEPLPPGATPAEPLQSPAAWLTSDDYPSAALRAEQQGVSVFVLAIDAQGIPTGCETITSSGFPLLDTTTCAIMQRRGRFKPARDASGKPIASRWKNVLRWAIP